MEITYNQAIDSFTRLPKEKQLASLHPYYVATDALRDRELKPTYWLYENQGEFYYHGFHLAAVPDTGYYDIQSPYGYGGPVASTENADFLKAAHQAYAQWCLEKNVLVEFLRLHPLLENWKYFSGSIKDDRQTVFIDLAGEGDLFSQYATRVRTAIRKAIQLGLRVIWVKSQNALASFVTLYAATMKNVNADSFYFFSEEYFNKMFEWQQLNCALCYFQNTVVGASFFLESTDVMEYHLSASNEIGRKMSSTNLILHEAALLAKKHGCKKLYLGGGSDSGDSNPLFFFKKGFSDKTALFKIGYHVYREGDYRDMKQKWQQQQCGREPSKVLFYRF